MPTAEANKEATPSGYGGCDSYPHDKRVEGILFAVDFARRPRFYYPRILIALAVAWDCLVHLPGERIKTVHLNYPGLEDITVNPTGHDTSTASPSVLTLPAASSLCSSPGRDQELGNPCSLSQ